MKAIISSKLAEGDSTQDAGLAFLQVGQLAGMSPTQYGRNLLEQAGLKSLEAVKNAFVRDSGTTVTVTDGAGGLSVSTDRPGWVVIDSCAGDHRASHFQTFAGAAAQVWSVLALHDAGTVTFSESSPNESRTITFQGMGPLGMKSVVMAPLETPTE